MFRFGELAHVVVQSRLSKPAALGVRVQRQLRETRKENRMPHRLAAFAIALFLAACSSAPTPHSAPQSALEGVVSVDLTPLPGATIRLAKGNDAIVRTAVTNGDGRY